MTFKAIAAWLLLLLPGAVSAQVSDTDYPRYYDFIVSNAWECFSAQPFDGVEDGELNMIMELHFQPKNGYEAYRFTGNGSESMNIEGRDYVGRFRFEGFGFNNASFGTGVSITKATITSADTPPAGWYWNDGENIQLHLVKHADGYSLEGYQNINGATITYECSGLS